jgi:hypothetical protein
MITRNYRVIILIIYHMQDLNGRTTPGFRKIKKRKKKSKKKVKKKSQNEFSHLNCFLFFLKKIHTALLLDYIHLNTCRRVYIYTIHMYA